MKELFLGALAGLALAGGAAAATVDTVQSPSGYFTPSDAVKYDDPYYRWSGSDWGWTHGAITESFSTAALQISAFDVDFDSGEVDEIYAKDEGAWILLGNLAGASDEWAYTDFTLDSSLYDELATGLELMISIDVDYGGWAVTLAKSVITTDGAAPPPPDPSPVPVPAALPLLGAGLAALGLMRRRARG